MRATKRYGEPLDGKLRHACIAFPPLLLKCISILAIALQASAWSATSPQQEPHTAPQELQILPSYEGQNVASVELAGQLGTRTSSVQNLILQRPNTPFSREKVQKTIDVLERIGHFDAIQLELRPAATGVRILFILQPAMYFGIYEFPGATNHFSYSRLLQVSGYPPQGAYTPVDVENARNALEKFFHRSGFFNARVASNPQIDQPHGLVNVSFDTVLGRRAKFGRVNIVGTTPKESEFLATKVTGIIARLKSASIIAGKTYKLKHLQNATTYLQDELLKQHHLAASVRLIGADYNPETNKADITFNVQTGPLVNVRVQGAHLWSWTRKKLLPVYQEAGLGPELIQEGRQNLISHFQESGYFDAAVDVEQRHAPDTESIVYTITKGKRRKVDDVEIVGNLHMRASDLLGHAKVSKGHFFSHGEYGEQLIRSSVRDLRRVYQANGYTDVAVTAEVKSQSNGNLVIKFHVTEGPQVIVETLKVIGVNPAVDKEVAPRGFKLGPGKPYSQQLVDEDRTHIIQNYLLMGYLNASFRAIANPSNEKHRVDVTYEISEGPRVQTARVIVLGRHQTTSKMIDRTVQLAPQAPMRKNELLKSENELYKLGIFDWAAIDPRRTITTQAQEDAVVKVHEAKRNTLAYGFGFEVINRGGNIPSGTVVVPGLPPVGLSSTFKTSESTFWGPRGTLLYTRKNVHGKGETISIGGLAGRLNQRFKAGYLDPQFLFTRWSSNLTLSAEHNSDNPIFTARLAEAGWQLQRALNRDKTSNLFLRYSFRLTSVSDLLVPDLVPLSDRHVRLSTLSTSFVRDTRDSALDATKGSLQSVELGLNPEFMGSNFSFSRFMGQSAYYKKVFRGILWANSLRLGLQRAFDGSHVPVGEKFFTGGAGTLRGFPLNGAGPQHTIQACGTPGVPSTCSAITVPTGGTMLFIVNSEFRIPVNVDLPIIHRNLGVALFYDGGNVYAQATFNNLVTNYSNTVGFGVYYKTPVGPFRIDIGHNLRPIPGIKSTQVFFSLGHAF